MFSRCVGWKAFRQFTISRSIWWLCYLRWWFLQGGMNLNSLWPVMLASVHVYVKLSFSQRLATWFVTLRTITVEGGEELSEAESMEAAEASILFLEKQMSILKKIVKHFKKSCKSLEANIYGLWFFLMETNYSINPIFAPIGATGHLVSVQSL